MIPLFYWAVEIYLVYCWLRQYNMAARNITTVPSVINWIAWIGLLAFIVTVSTIDSGHMADHVHSACAVVFFVLLLVYSVVVTLIIANLKKVHPEMITESSWRFKLILMYLWLIPLASLVFSLFKFDWGVPVAEWTGTYLIIFYLKSFAEDFEDYVIDIDDEGFKLKKLEEKIKKLERGEEDTSSSQPEEKQSDTTTDTNAPEERAL